MNQICRIFFCAAIFVLAAAVSAETCHQIDLGKGGSWNWIDSASVRNENGFDVLAIDVPASLRPQSVRHAVSMPFDVAAYRGRSLRLTVECRSDNVSVPRQAWNGVKFLLHYRKDGRDVWRSPSGLRGTFGWKKLEISFLVPEGATGGKLMLGLEESSGRVEFRNLQTTVKDISEIFPPQKLPNNYRVQYSEQVKSIPPLRGAMSPAALREGDLEELRSWGAALIRWQLVRNWGQNDTDRDVAEYLRWVDAKLIELEQVLDRAEKLGLRVIVDLHSPPGGRSPDLGMLDSPEHFDAFLKTWRKIASRLKDKPALWAYDLVNEPMQSRPCRIDYLTAQKLAAEEIRRIDPATPIIVESNDWCSPQAFRYLSPLPLDNIIYQLHMYWPGGYTHQGVNNNWGVAGKDGMASYPDSACNRQALIEHLRPVRDFQQRYGARIYVGEFSAVRWAPGAERYLEDCISLFEEYGWDWTYHAFREWNGWSVEHTENPQDNEPAQTDTARKKVLLKYFKRNQR